LAFLEAILMPVPDWNAIPRETQDMFRAFRSPDHGQDLIVNHSGTGTQAIAAARHVAPTGAADRHRRFAPKIARANLKATRQARVSHFATV
jgi:hypothetical protein